MGNVRTRSINSKTKVLAWCMHPNASGFSHFILEKHILENKLLNFKKKTNKNSFRKKKKKIMPMIIDAHVSI